MKGLPNLPYCFSGINGYADLTLYIVVPVYIILGIYSFIELKKKREIPIVMISRNFE